MKERYGVVGTGTAPEKVIHAALDDITNKVMFYVPWYGKPTEGLEHVYDWLIDNEAEFHVVCLPTAKVPKALSGNILHATNGDVDNTIIEALNTGSVKGLALVLWDEERQDYSQSVAEYCINSGLPTLELTNGLVPIIFDDAPSVEVEIEEDPTDTSSTESFDRPTLEIMPAAVVKRMAKDNGFDVKTKDEAISALLGDQIASKNEVLERMDIPDRHIVSVTVRYSDGTTVEL